MMHRMAVAADAGALAEQAAAFRAKKVRRVVDQGAPVGGGRLAGERLADHAGLFAETESLPAHAGNRSSTGATARLGGSSTHSAAA